LIPASGGRASAAETVGVARPRPGEGLQLARLGLPHQASHRPGGLRQLDRHAGHLHRPQERVVEGQAKGVVDHRTAVQPVAAVVDRSGGDVVGGEDRQPFTARFLAKHPLDQGPGVDHRRGACDPLAKL
jgi:hypothetical protein